MSMSFDLLTTVEQGGCSAKLSPVQLASALAGLPQAADANLLVGIGTRDDAGVYRISDDMALIQTVDFFPPVCSDPFEFGQIAAANALSDVYAMGGTPLTVLNIALFPSSRISLDVLKEILAGGLQKIIEAGAVVVGGHTIDDFPPKYGCAVTGIVNPGKIITNAAACPGDCLLLTKPLGTGAIIAGKRVGEASEESYRAALESMKQLNKTGGGLMQEFGVKAATDITGFGLFGHAFTMAAAGNVTLHINSADLPILDGARELIDTGCIPGGAFRNLDFVETGCSFAPALDYNLKMLMADPQTSGGLLLCAPPERSGALLEKLKNSGYPKSAIIGGVLPFNGKRLTIG